MRKEGRSEGMRVGWEREREREREEAKRGWLVGRLGVLEVGFLDG